MKKAFTLIELLVVMVIAVVIMAVAIPGFMGMGKGMAMRGATRNIHSVLSLSRQWAITHRKNVTVRYGKFFNGLHTGGSGATLIDCGGSFPVDNPETEETDESLKDHVLYKLTGGGHGTIITNTATTITAGGLTWLLYDRYRIDDPPVTLSSYCITGDNGDYIQKSEPLNADVIFDDGYGSFEFNDEITFISTGGLKVEADKTIIIADRNKKMLPANIFIRWLTGGITVQ